MKQEKYIEFLLPSEINYLEKTRNEVKQFLLDNDYSNKIAIQVMLSIDEAVSNIMEYAHKWEPKLITTIKIWVNEDNMVIKIYDEGKHDFFPVDKGKLDVKEHFKTKKMHRGLGWYIIRKVMDEVEYEHLEKGNLLTLIKNKEKVNV